MATIIRIKRSTGTSAPSTLKTGELAYSAGTGLYNNGGDRLYFGKGDDGTGESTSKIAIGGEYYTSKFSESNPDGSIEANKVVILDANAKVNSWNVDNITINNNTISSTNTNGNVVIDPNGSGVVDVSTSRITNVVDPQDAQDAATKAYVDAKATATTLTVIGDANSDTIDLDDSDLTIAGGTGLSTAVTDNTVTINIDNTGVSANTYGSTTQIPVITVNAQGQITTATTAAVSSVLGLLATDGPSAGNVSLLDSDLQFTGGEGIDISVTGPTVTIAAELATTSNLGVASFNTNNFTVSSGAVSSKDITLGTTALTLGESTTTIAGLTQIDVDNVRIFDNTVASSTGVLYLDPNPIDSDGGEVIVRGNFTVQGITTTVNSTTVSINDKNLVLADSAASAGEADGAGITVNGPTTPATFTYNGSTDRWNFNKDIDISSLSALKIGGTDLNEAIEDHLVNNFFLAGEGIDLTYVDGSNTFTISAELATTTNPGVASFDADQFTVTSGAVTVSELDGGTY